MAKSGSSDGKKAPPEDKKEQEDPATAWDAIPKALKEAGQRATDLAQNPYARGLLAAGLVTAAAALAANKNVRDTTRRNVKDATEAATEAAEVAADNAGKIGVAIINAATEAVQRMLNLSAEAAGAAATEEEAAATQTAADAPKPAGDAPAAKAPRRKQPATVGGGKAKTSASKPTAAKSGAKKASPTRKPATKQGS
jgi:hypothetical protein